MHDEYFIDNWWCTISNLICTQELGDRFLTTNDAWWVQKGGMTWSPLIYNNYWRQDGTQSVSGWLNWTFQNIRSVKGDLIAPFKMYSWLEVFSLLVLFATMNGDPVTGNWFHFVTYLFLVWNYFCKIFLRYTRCLSTLSFNHGPRQRKNWFRKNVFSDF